MRRRPLLRQLAGAVVATSALVAVGVSPATAIVPHSTAVPVTQRTWKSGVYTAYGAAADLQVGTWRGAAVQTATEFLGSSTWAEIENPSWAISEWGAQPSVQVDFSVAMFPASGGSLAEAASGAYDSYFAVLAKNLVAGHLGNSIIRLGWEFNIPYYRWSVATTTDAANYAAAWRKIVGTMRSVSGAHFGFDWAPAVSASGVNPQLAFPGASYVTDIGLDVYDWSEAAGDTAAQRWDQLVNNGYGLAWQAKFAATQHRPVAFPEWGLVYATYAPSLSGGDDPMFVRNMFTWFASHNTAFENYFDADSSDGEYNGITTATGLFPTSVSTYQSEYSGTPYA